MKNPLGAHTFRDYQFAGIECNGDCTIYQLAGSEGEGHGEMRCFQVLPGILLTYDRLEMKSCYQEVAPAEGYLQINQCVRGCYEYELADGQVCFMNEGDMCVSNPWSLHFTASRLPLEYYEGISVIFEVEAAQKSLDAFFPQVHIDLRRLREQLFSGTASHLVRARPELGRVFTELYRVDERFRETYCALKVLELILFLPLILEKPREQLPRFSQSVVERTKNAYEYLVKSDYQPITVQALAKRFCISQSVLQQCFRSIYGQPVASFLRTQRIQRSAALLRDESFSVGEVAQMAGYENQSKFASAFKAVMGASPLAYRHRAAPLSGESEQK